MPYTQAVAALAGNTTQDTWTAAASTGVAVGELAAYPDISLTAGDFIELFRSTGGTTPTATTPEKTNTNSAAAAVSAKRGNGTDPTKSGTSLVVLGYATIVTTLAVPPRRWLPPDPRQPILIPPSGQMTTRLDASGNVPLRCTVFAEPDFGRFASRTRGRRGRTPGAWHHQDYATGCNGLATRPVAPQLGGEFRFLVPSDWDTPPVVSPVWLLGGGGTLFTASLAGTITDAGALTNQANKALVGTLTDAGALTKLALKGLAGALTDAGALAKQANKALSGTLTTAGTLANALIRAVALAGSLATSGALAKRANKALSGALTTAGALARQANKALVGALTDAGALTKRANKPLAGTLTDSGALANVKVAVLALAGTLTTAGTLARRANKALAGGLTSAGALARQAAKPLTGTLTTAGTLARRANRALAGALTPTGALGNVYQAGAAAVALGRVFALGARQLTMRAAGRLTTVGAQPRALTAALRGRATTLAARARQLLYGMRGR